MLARILILGLAFCINAYAFNPQEHTPAIDSLINQGLLQQGITPNHGAQDQEFLKRLYLSAAGRLPTYDEILEYTSDHSQFRRQKIINKILLSEAYVSNFYIFWADILRIQRNLPNNANRYGAGEAYVQWVKRALRNNMPYDKFVHNLVTARGSPWDNGAVGYYLRDPGMNLDNTANTIQIFLGTRIGCAQCHDHPFDEWTQYEYYELAAFQWGVETRINPELRNIVNKKIKDDKLFSGDPQKKRELGRLVREMFEPISYGVKTNNKKKLQLPHDYKYDNAKPKEAVSARTIIGKEVVPEQGGDKIDQFGEWMTSPDNPFFTRTIVNRLWKHVMGVGLYEPIDDYKEGIEISNPKLLRALEQIMRKVDYDLKKFLSVLYNTQAFQRKGHYADLVAGKPFYYQGPIAQRMTAEQIWDNIATLIVPNLDNRKKFHDYERLLHAQKYGVAVKGKTPEQVLELATKVVEIDAEYVKQIKDLNVKSTAAKEAGDKKQEKELRDKLNQINRERKRTKEKELYGIDFRRIKSSNQYDEPWKKYGKQFIRASEVDSPAPNGHFLREFGAADRASIESGNRYVTVPQLLSLLNGSLYREIANPNSLLMQKLAGHKEDKKKQIKIIYLSMLCRQPTEKEIELFKPELLHDIIWTLLNSKEFVFTV